MRTCLCLLMLAVLIISCEVKVKPGSSGNDKPGSKIRNGVELNQKGLKAEQAFLVYEDGSIVSNENKIDVNQKVVLRLVLDGWKEENGKVWLGAAERISTSEGHIILDSEDLFAGYTDGVSADDAKMVTLSAVITQLDKLYDHFLVQFRVWDKKDGGGEISGSYKLYLR